MSVVIPALNEHSQIRRALDSTRQAGVERIVVDGGSLDGTVEAARFLKAERVIQAPAGRASQMQAGFRAASGDVVLFLHADTRLEEGWLEALLRALCDTRALGGAFRLHFESERWLYRWLEWVVRFRCRSFGLPYGDQGLFVRRKALEDLGGIVQTPIFEDIDLARTIREHGRLVLLPERAFTSPRRYEANGPLRMIGRNFLALLGYLLDVDREKLARWYRRKPRS